MKSIFILICLFITFQSTAQIFNKTYGTHFQDYGTAITRTDDGGFAVTGVTYGQGADGEIFILKLNHQGVVLWTKKIFGVNIDKPVAIYQLSNGNYIIAGNTGSYGWGCGSAAAIMLDSNASLLWARTYGDIDCNSIFDFSPTTDGGFIGCGNPGGPSVTYNGWIFKIDINGYLIWSKIYSTIGAFSSIRQTQDGGYLTVNIKSGIDLLKIDSLGNSIWRKVYISNSGNVQSFDIETYGNCALITGEVYLNAIGSSPDVYVLNIDSVGDRIWFKTYGSSFAEYGHSVSKTLIGDIVISGKTNSSGHGDIDMFLIKTNSNGNLIWSNTYGDAWEDLSEQVYALPDSGFVSVGHSYRNSANFDSSFVYVVRTDKNGSTCNEYGWLPIEQTQNYNPVVQTVSEINWGLDSAFTTPVTSIHFSEQELCLIDQTSEFHSLISEENIHIFPNPAINFTTIKYSNRDHEINTIRIFDMFGKLKFEFQDAGDEFTLNTELYSNGFYHLEIVTPENILRTSIIIKH